MGQVLHGSARTTARIREEIQESKESISSLAKKYNVSRATVYKWKKVTTVVDRKSGPIKPRSVLSELEEQIIVEFKKKTLLSLDDCLLSLKDVIPNLTRSNLHRCLQRYSISNLKPKDKEQHNKQGGGKFKDYPIGFVHIDTTEIILSKEKKYYLFVAIERNTKLVFVKLYTNKTMQDSGDFLRSLVEFFPFKIHTILTDNGIEYTFNLFKKPINKVHLFDMICQDNRIKHKTTEFKSPWTNGQVEIMNKQIKENTTRKYEYQSLEQLEKHLQTYITAYNFAKRLKSLKLLTPYQKTVELYENDKSYFKDNPVNKFVGWYT